MTADSNPMRRALVGQLDIAWALASYHLDGLTTDECLWRPAARGLHVIERTDGSYLAEWPDHEGYDLGPPSIGWLTWHMIFWWSMVLDHGFGEGTLQRETIAWPGLGRGGAGGDPVAPRPLARRRRRPLRRRPRHRPAHAMAVRRAAVRRDRRLGQHRTDEERIRDRLCALPLRRAAINRGARGIMTARPCCAP